MDPHAGLTPALRRRLLAWYGRHHRDLPWRGATDPYRIWLSEIMLQQTRAQAVIPYYEKFLSRFPTAAALAAASEAEVLAAWSGLGYYARARNLRRAARQIAAAGDFPRLYPGIRALHGVGDYTAAAISSIAFGLPHAVLDGNVMRVLSRLLDDTSDIASPRTRARFQSIAQHWLDPRRPGVFNQAIMELGATICLPKTPLCQSCPLAARCLAHQAGTASQLPVKLRKAEPQSIAAQLVFIQHRNRILLWQRPASSQRMGGFWELPAPDQLPEFSPGPALAAFRHTITHHHYTFTVLSGTLRRTPKSLCWIPQARLSAIPLSTTTRKALHLCTPYF
jgi:A/G-specific adenine glycosylase